MPEINRPQLVAYVLAALIVVVLGVRFMQGHARDGTTGTSAAGPRADSASVRVERSPPAAALVHVAGAVQRPGVYRLRAGQRIQDAVRRAGGPRGKADLNAINLAAKVADGQQIVVPRRGVAGAAAAGTASSADGGAAATPQAPVSLNSASAEQLETLDGVGPATAHKIIDWRTQHGGFRTIEDLSQVPGIGPKRLAALREKVQL
jgi:competence protein ComEA